VRSAEERLRFYAEQFNTVEVDSTYYALPAERNAKLWTERTPDGFVFNIKPFALMTQHPAEVSRLPKQLREMLPAEEQSDRQLTRPSKKSSNGVPVVLERDGAAARSTQAWDGGLSVSAVFHPEAGKAGLPRASCRTASESFDRNRVPSLELGSRRNSTYRNHELSAIAWLVLHFDRRART
jgi:hypothetical protein